MPALFGADEYEIALCFMIILLSIPSRVFAMSHVFAEFHLPCCWVGGVVGYRICLTQSLRLFTHRTSSVRTWADS